MNRFHAIYLKLARDQEGLSQSELAQRLRVKQAVLSKYENGLIDPPDEMRGRIAAALDYPESFFCQDEVDIPSGLVFHRKRSSLSARVRNRVEAEVRARSLDVLRLFRHGGVHSDVIVRKTQTPAEMARRLRRHWNVGRGPIPDLTALLESRKIAVLSFDFGTDKLDGFFMPLASDIVAIALNDNAAFTMDRRRHTLAHELGHAVLNHCVLQFPGEACEKEADAFAAEFLLPEESIRPALTPPLTPTRFRELKGEWGVSMGSLLYRAHTLGIVRDFAYRRMWMHFSSLGYRRREPVCGVRMERPKLLSALLRRFLAEDPAPLATLRLTPERFNERYSEMKGGLVETMRTST